MKEIILSTREALEGYRIIKTIGVVRGNTVRSRNIAKNFLGNLKTIAGGEITEFSKLLSESRDQALERLSEHAKELGANAVVAIRIASSDMGQCSEVLAYGTGVVVEKI